jgi:serine/threonine protein kinase
LTGERAFEAASFKELLRKNMVCNISFESIVWSQVTSEAKDLVQRMIEKKNPLLRISAKDALAHPWFTLEHNSSNQLSLPQENISKYCGVKYFNMENIKPDFSGVKNTEIKKVGEDSTGQDINSICTSINSKYEYDSYGLIEIPNELPYERDASNLEENDISERAEHDIISIDRLFMTKGVREYINTPLKRKIKQYSNSKLIKLTLLENIECEKKCSSDVKNFTELINKKQVERNNL